MKSGSRESLLTRVVLFFLLGLFRLQGWTLSGQAPASRRCIIIGAPHTSNWDFIFFLGATKAFGLRPNFMGKHSLFRWPLRRFMREMGGVPVIRASSQNYVDQTVAEFGRREDMVLVVAPEGTRKGAPRWKSGFYHIAHGAGVPIVPGWVDQAGRRGGLGPEISTTGDYEADVARIAAFYRSVLPGHPRLSAITGSVGE